jgi:hypothetical protein
MSKNICPACNKPVYAAEQVSAVGKTWHKTCLRCTECKKVVTFGNWSDTGGKIYCNHCYDKKFVDDETKQYVFELETGHAKKLYGNAVALPGQSKSPPPQLTSKSPRQDSGIPSPPPTSPRKGMSADLQNAIVNHGLCPLSIH